MNEVLVSANYEGYESKSINFTEINNIVKERFNKIDETERKKEQKHLTKSTRLLKNW